MNDAINPRIDDPASFKEFAGEDAAFAIIVNKDGEQLYVIPKGVEYETTPSLGTQSSLKITACYYKCANGKLYYCCGNFCVRVGVC